MVEFQIFDGLGLRFVKEGCAACAVVQRQAAAEFFQVAELHFVFCVAAVGRFGVSGQKPGADFTGGLEVTKSCVDDKSRWQGENRASVQA